MAFRATKRKNGLLQKSFFITLPNGIRKRQFVYGRDRKTIQDKYNKRMAEAINGCPVISSQMTVEQYLSEWIKDPRDIKEATRLKYAGEIRKHIIPNIGKIKLCHLTTPDVQGMMDNLVKNGVSVRTTQILKNILSKALREAEKKNLVTPGIMDGVELNRYVPKERVIWTEEEVKRFIESSKDSNYHFFFSMYVTYGLRRGEAIAIRWEDIDLDKKVIHIRRQYTFEGSKAIITGTKTTNSIRDLPIVAHIEDLLRELGRKQKQGFVIEEDGKPVNPNKVNREFERIKKKTGLPDVTLHSLRHYAATALKNIGAEVKDVQMIMGHSNPSTTIQYYQHSSLENRNTVITKYAEMMGF